MKPTREFWIRSMQQITAPIFQSLACEQLKQNLPNRFYGSEDRSDYGALEAFGRSFCGFAPFLNNFPRSEQEEALAEDYRALLRTCLDHATDPTGPDYLNFGQNGGTQPLVDAAFLCHGLLRSGSFATELPQELKQQIIRALEISRSIMPWETNWILFSAMVELGIDLLGGESDLLRVLYAVRQLKQWYRGDGMYADGSDFHMDYYNSFVIQPMLVDICRYFAPRRQELADFLPIALQRASRYAAILERMINHDGTYVYTGRSITYRFGAFQLLSQSMLQGFSDLSPASVRCALTEVIRSVMSRRIFDEKGYLLHGIYGFQPSLAEAYICTGSLYLCTAVFLPLGLPESHPFWADPDRSWTSKKIVSGLDVPCDHAQS